MSPEGGVVSCALALYHPVHGAKTKLDSIYAAEEALEAQLQHADAATQALDFVAAIRHQLHHLTATPASATASPAQLADKFLRVAADLRRLESFDPAMAQADFFVALQAQLQAAHEHIVQTLLDAFASIVQVRVSGLPPAAETRTLIVAPSSTLPLPRLFSALHSLRASPRVLTLLGDQLLQQFITPLLRDISSHPLAISMPLYFSTVKRPSGGGPELEFRSRIRISSS